MEKKKIKTSFQEEIGNPLLKITLGKIVHFMAVGEKIWM